MSQNSPKPTKRGIQKYPDTNGYYNEYAMDNVTVEEQLPCTCLDKCSDICDGKRCKCEACRCHYNDYLSCDFD